MLNVRRELSTVVRACEQLISAVHSNSTLSVEERLLVAYYAKKLSKISDGDGVLWSDRLSGLSHHHNGAAKP